MFNFTTANKFMSLRSTTLALGLSASLLSGCSYLEPYKAPITQGNVVTQESVDLLQEGLSKSQVVELFGPPLGEHPFNPNHWEYTYYSSLSNERTQVYTRHLILKFDDDQYLESWQETPQSIQLNEDKSFLGLGWF